MVGPDHQHPPHGSGAQELRRRDQRKQEAAAGSSEIESHGVAGAKQGLHLGRRAEQVIGGGGGEQHQIEAVCFPSRHGKGLASGVGGQAGEGLIRPADATGLNAGPGADPFVVGVDPLPELIVDDLLPTAGTAAGHQGHAAGRSGEWC